MEGPTGRGQAEDGTAAHDPWSYRAHLDGLRALAVYLVVAFHAGANRLSGGFIGVDVFFVLSGYLVTNLLLRDIATSSRIRLGRFYARRIRRLLPAAGVNLLVTALVFRAIGAPSELPSATGSMRAASLYVSNWWFIRESADYFGSNIAKSPVLHYWSLSVEEQFYVVWPLLLGGLALLARRCGRRRRVVLAAAVAALAAVSLGEALAIAVHHPNRAYYGTDTRAYQLLAGALLAIVPSVFVRVRRLPQAERALRAAGIALVAVLVAVSTNWISVGPVTRGVAAAAATIGLIVSLEGARGGPARRLLSLAPISYLGRISYGIYLWHWIVIVVAVREHHLGPLATLAVTVPVATALAALSYAVIERPIRLAPRLDQLRPAVIACGLATSALVGLVAMPQLLHVTGARTLGSSADGRTPVKVEWQAAHQEVPDDNPCELKARNVCRLTTGTGPRVLLVGDSHAAVLAPVFTAIAKRHDLTLAAVYLPYCPWVRHIRYPVFGPFCFRDQKALFEQRIPAFDPDIIVLVHRTVDDPNDPITIGDQDLGHPKAGPEKDAVLARRVRATIDALRKPGRKIVIMEPIPVSKPDAAPLQCLSKASYVEQCRFTASASPLPEERTFRAIDAARSDVWSIDIDRLVCPHLPTCDPIVGGHIVMYDNSHLTSGFAKTLTGRIDRTLVAKGILPR